VLGDELDQDLKSLSNFKGGLDKATLGGCVTVYVDRRYTHKRCTSSKEPAQAIRIEKSTKKASNDILHVQCKLLYDGQ
jgi:hypothetical protein